LVMITFIKGARNICFAGNYFLFRFNSD